METGPAVGDCDLECGQVESEGSYESRESL